MPKKSSAASSSKRPKSAAASSNVMNVTSHLLAAERVQQSRKQAANTTAAAAPAAPALDAAEPNVALTANGAVSLRTTESPRLDLFYSGLVRGAPASKVCALMDASWRESARDTVAMVLQSRDCRGVGKGEKLVSNEAMLWLRRHKPATYLLNLAAYVQQGYLKDLLWLAHELTTRPEFKSPSAPLFGERDLVELELFAELLKQDFEAITLAQQKQKDAAAAAAPATDAAAAAATTTTDAAAAAPAPAATDAAAAPAAAEGAEVAETGSDEADKKALAKQAAAEKLSILPVSISLAGKWAPSERGHFDKTAQLAKRLARLLFPDAGARASVLYRRMLSTLRRQLLVVERLMCDGQWQCINFAAVPSKAHLILKKAFTRHQADRYAAFLGLVKSGGAKINTTGLQPHELVRPYLQSSGTPLDETSELQWTTVVAKLRESGSFRSCVSLVDVSGSMSCVASGSTRCLDVAVALGLLTSELTEPPFKNRIITFHETPTWFNVTGDSLHERVRSIASAPWGGSTDIQAAFQLILDVAVSEKLAPNDLPKTLFIYSDMQFNSADRDFAGSSATTFQNVQAMFKKAGYTAPSIVFWNLNGRSNNDFPVKVDTPGVALMSGFSGELLKIFMAGQDMAPLAVLLLALEPYYQHVKIDPEEE